MKPSNTNMLKPGSNNVVIRNGQKGQKNPGKAAPAASHNPFGKEKTEKSALQILQETFVIGVRDFDYGVDVWDPLRREESTGKLSPGFKHVPHNVLEVVIEFATNEGKGTGRQCIPAGEFLGYVQVLRDIHESGYETPPEADRTVYVPTFDVARSSFAMIAPKKTVSDGKGGTKTIADPEAPRDLVSVRCVSGKGAKPMVVPKAQFLGIVEALELVAQNLEDHVELAWQGYDDEIDAGKIERPDNYPAERLEDSEDSDTDVADLDESDDAEEGTSESLEEDLESSGLDEGLESTDSGVADESVDFDGDEDEDADSNE